jgi:hypothetical protein
MKKTQSQHEASIANYANPKKVGSTKSELSRMACRKLARQLREGVLPQEVEDYIRSLPFCGEESETWGDQA